ncbi:MAG TPA: bifunctional homocysteine S-methyltransferase/methylenetetrahydrofolate reductase [Ktedonobacterales bacterium]
MSDPVLELLRRGPLLADGAMGTMLYARAQERLTSRRCFDELVLTDPQLVQMIHREYIFAGARIIETNSFGANIHKLAPYGLADRVSQINRDAARIAREAREVAGHQVFIAGAVGPSGNPRVPKRSDTEALAELRGLFREQIAALVEGGVDLIQLETFTSLTELREAVAAAQEVSALPIVAQITVTDDGRTLSGNSPAETVRALVGMGVHVIGCNCGVGPAGIEDALSEMLNTLREMDAEDDVLLSALPNAGLPTRVEGRYIYLSTPDYFAGWAHRMATAGVRLIGGCCGTTPAHTSAMHAALASVAPASSVSVATAAAPAARVTWPEDAPESRRAEPLPSRLAARLATGEFALSVELDPPKGLNPGKVVEGAKVLRESGVEFINIADSPMARVRMSCISLARLLLEECGVEPIIHFTTRDRNLMALQSDLLGAHALGISNILALTGDPMRSGNYPNLTGVWDIDSVGLLEVLRGMNEGHDAAGAPLGGQATFFYGAALNLNVSETLTDLSTERERNKVGLGEPGHQTEFDLELARLRHKLDAGASFIMTQPIYELAPLERLLTAFGPVDVPIILGMIPLHSWKHADYLHNEVPGISVPEEVRARLREAGDHGRDMGIELAHDIVTQARARGMIQGCYLMPSYGRYDVVGDLASELLR